MYNIQNFKYCKEIHNILAAVDNFNQPLLTLLQLCAKI